MRQGKIQPEWGEEAYTPEFTWNDVVAGLTNLATTETKQRMVPALVSAIRKREFLKTKQAVMMEILCLAWCIADETFNPEELVEED